VQSVSEVTLVKHYNFYAFQGNTFILIYRSKLVIKLEEYKLLFKLRRITHLGNLKVVNIWMWAVLSQNFFKI